MKDQELRRKVQDLEYRLARTESDRVCIWMMLTDLLTDLGYKYKWESTKPAGWKVTKK